MRVRWNVWIIDILSITITRSLNVYGNPETAGHGLPIIMTRGVIGPISHGRVTL